MAERNIRFYEFGEFKLDARRRILLKNDSPVQVSSRIFDLLLIFVQNEGRVLEHNELLDKVWEGAFVEQSNLKKAVSALRQILGESASESLFIKTIPRKGYSFVAPVRELPEETEDVRPEKIKPVSPEPLEIPSRSEEILAAPVIKARRSLLIVAACIVIFVLTALGIWQFFRGRDSAGNFHIENLKIQKLTGSGNIEEAALSPDGKTYVYAAGEDGKQALWAKRVGAPNALQLAPAGSDNNFRSLVISPDNNFVYYSVAFSNEAPSLYRLSILGGERRKITEDLSSAASFSPDGKKIAFVRDMPDGRRVLFTVNAEDGSDEREIHAVTDNHKMIAPQWSPDGKTFAFINSESTAEGRIWAISEIPAAPGSSGGAGSGGEPKYILTPQKGKVYYFNWMHDGSGLVVCTEPNDYTQSQLWYVSYPAGKMTRLTNDISTYQNISVSDDGNTMLAVQREKTGDLWVMNWSLLQNYNRLTDSQNFLGPFAVLPNGKIAAEAIENGQRGLTLLNSDGTGPQPLFTKSNVERVPSISPDGKSLYFISVRSGTQEIWQSDPDGRDPRKLTDYKTFLHTVKGTPDGKSVYFELYDGVRWRLEKMPAEGGEYAPAIEETIGDYAFSPDGNQLAYSYFDEQKKNWRAAIRNLTDNAIQKQFDISPSSMLLWTRDGKNLLYNVSDSGREGGSLWMQPLDNSAPRLVLEAKDDKVMWADWSPDGGKLFFTRGKTISNIVLLSKGKEN
jgi:Tol biopolymer transport system component/DNA-binding winged helix-turn-helix (wHTH) protein